MATRVYEGKKFDGFGTSTTKDALTVEGALQIVINNEPYTVTMRTPGDDIALVRGLLHAEGVLSDLHFTPEVVLNQTKKTEGVTRIDLRIPKEKLDSGYTNSRSLLSVSSCGICGKTELEDLSSCEMIPKNSEGVSISSIHRMFETMNTVQHSFHRSGGSHAAAAFDKNGKLLACMEDIGRHNAVDKVVGSLLIQKKIKQAVVLIVSGRVSYEIIVKTFKAKIPILCAVSAPSSLAVDYAKELGISLLAFCRGDRATCYAHPQRIANTNVNSRVG